MSRTISRSASSSHSAHIWDSGVRGRVAAFPIYGRPTAPWAGHVALCLRKPRRRETEREARGLPRTWTAYTRMRCGTTRNLAALRTAYRRAVELGPESVGSSRGDGSGALSDMAALSAAGRRALGSMGRMPTKRFAASRSASLRFDGLYRRVAEQCLDPQCALMANQRTAGL